MAKYESEHTKFMREWLEKNPAELKQKEIGRALWWDKTPRDLDAQKREAAAKVAPKAYYYDVN
jgi:Protein of unknown function (DUF3460)